MIYSGLVSVTLKHLVPEEIVPLVKKAGLDGIEWWGDGHVLPGDTARAREVFQLTHDAGLQVAAYGSYYRVGKENAFPFEQVVESAKALEAPVIRVWAGMLASDQADENHWNRVVEDGKRIADIAKDAGILVAFEFHRNTLTDTNETCLRLLHEINHPFMKSYWQPSPEMQPDERLEGLKSILPWLTNLHVFHWVNGKRLPLAEGIHEWIPYMEAARNAQGNRYAMLEFVCDNTVEQFLEDAAELIKLLA